MPFYAPDLAFSLSQSLPHVSFILQSFIMLTQNCLLIYFEEGLQIHMIIIIY
jgi:hypothetical protein